MAVEERKPVTVLFADVVGSTAMAGANDPEVVRSIMSRYFDRLAEIAASHGGTVEKFAGDAVMIVFGVPAVHDDDAERGVRTALASLEAVADLNRRLPIALSVRIGVNSGDAITAARADHQFLVSGDVVNVAARLQQGAEPGEVVVGELTEALTRGSIEYAERSPVAARGKPDPVRAFRAIRPRSAVPTQARGAPGLRAPLVGRTRELRLLVETFGRVVEERRPHLFTLTGPGGVGKSRLVAESLADPAFAGSRVLRGRCLPYGTGITYWPFIEMLDRRLPEVAWPESERVAITARLSVMLGLQTAAQVMPDVPAERVAKEIAWAVRRHFQTLGSTAPLAVVVDDLQWAEPPMIELVEHLTDRMVEVPLLVLAIARPELLEAHRGWGSGKPNATTLTLDPLDPAQTSDLISKLLDLDALPAEFRQRIVERSEGTPLYCEEFLQMLIEEGRLFRDGDRWVAADGGGEIAVPHTIQALLAARLDALDQTEKALLQAASIIGERFGADELQSLLGLADDTELDGVIAKGLVDEGDRPDEARFRHLLIRDAAYASMPKARRADLHDAYSALLERTSGADQVAEIIAYHAGRALTLSVELLLPNEVVVARARRAAQWALTLAERAYERRELPSLEAALEGARAAAAQLPEREAGATKAQIAIGHARLLLARGDYPAARAAVAEADELAEAAGLKELLADARLLDMWIFSQAGGAHFQQLQTMLLRLVEICHEIGDERRELEGRSVAAFSFWSEGMLSRYLEELTAIAERFRALGDEAKLAWALAMIATADVLRGGTDGGALLSQPAEIGARLGLREIRARILLTGGTLEMLRGHSAEAEEQFRSLVAFTEETGQYAIAGRRFLSYALMSQGRHAEAAVILDRAIELAESFGDRWARSELFALRSQVAVRLGDVVAADQLAGRCIQWLTEGDTTAETEAMQTVAQVRIAQGRDAEAEAAYLRGVEVSSGIEFQWPRTLIAVEYAQFLVARGRIDEARAILDEREPVLRSAGWHLFDDAMAEMRKQMVNAGP